MNKVYLLLLISSSIIYSCKKDDDTTSMAVEKEDTNATTQLIFGHYYGMCAGEECVELFKLTNESLFEDELDNYAGEGPFQFVKLDNKKFELVKNLLDSVPETLLISNDFTIGCPDCADQGGLYIEFSREDYVVVRRIDQNKSQVPKELHDFVDKINRSIELVK